MDALTREAGAWWAQSRGTQAQTWIANYQNSLHARHRTQIVEAVRSLQAETVLEVGCHCGPNLVRLAHEWPALRMIGVDISAEAIAAGRSWVHGLGLASRIQLNAGRIPAVLEALPSQTCDVVISCYTLAYVAPADLDAVLYEMGRLATRGIVLAEPMPEGGAGTRAGPRSLTGYTEWAHDYAAAAPWIGSWRGMTLVRQAVSPPVDRLNAVLIATRGPMP